MIAITIILKQKKKEKQI